jgi:hypothetical protein
VTFVLLLFWHFEYKVEAFLKLASYCYSGKQRNSARFVCNIYVVKVALITTIFLSDRVAIPIRCTCKYERSRNGCGLINQRSFLLCLLRMSNFTDWQEQVNKYSCFIIAFYACFFRKYCATAAVNCEVSMTSSITSIRRVAQKFSSNNPANNVYQQFPEQKSYLKLHQ